MLIPEGRKKILEVFMANPSKEIHLREVARLSKSSLTNVDNSLRLFVKEGMFEKREVSNMTFFLPNLENGTLLKMFEVIELQRREDFYRKNKKIARLLKKYTQTIIDLSNGRIQSVILFGSVARGEWTKDSDIDILAIVAEKENDIIPILREAKKNTETLLEINSITTTRNNFAHGITRRTEFYEELWQDRVILYNEFLFWEIVNNSSRWKKS